MGRTNLRRLRQFKTVLWPQAYRTQHVEPLDELPAIF